MAESLKVSPLQANEPITDNQKTVKQRIDEIIDKYGEDKEELKKRVFELVQRVLYPDQFCPTCDERLFFDPPTSVYGCPNCGYKSAPQVAIPPVRIAPKTEGKVPEVVEKTIDQMNKSMQESGKGPIPKATPLGEKIRKLVDARDTGNVQPTQVDEARIRNIDKNIASKVNWV